MLHLPNNGQVQCIFQLDAFVEVMKSSCQNILSNAVVSCKDRITPQHANVDSVNIFPCAFKKCVEIVHNVAGSHDTAHPSLCSMDYEALSP